MNAWIFDVDGVITNPVEKRVTEPEILDELIKRLEKREPVALNTGRSLSWMMDRVIKPLDKKIDDKSVLDNFLAVGEKGGSWLTFENRAWQTNVDNSISLPDSLKERIRDLMTQDYPRSMLYDESKLTMISTEMKDGYDNALYTQQQRELEDKMRKIITEPEYTGLNLSIDPTQIAIDIQNGHVGKHFGAKRIEEWLAKKGIKPLHVVMFGDSQSDSEMAEEFQDRFSTEFVFVNNPDNLNRGKLPAAKVTFTNGRFEEGMLEYLKSHE